MLRSPLAALFAVLLSSAATQAATIGFTSGNVGSNIGGGQLNGNTFTIATSTGTDGANSFPSAEPPLAAIDGNGGTKYLNFGKTNTGYILTPSIGLSNVIGLSLATANDGPERDPFTFSLYGSTTATASSTAGVTFSLSTSFSPILLNQSTNLTTDPGRNTSIATINFTNTANYTTYLLVFPTVRDANNSNSMQIAEATLQGQAVPEPTSAVLAAGGLGVLGLVRRRRA